MTEVGRPLPDLDAIRLLVVIADCGSIGAAARREGITQPSASKRIAVLERRLGVELLRRSTRGSSLTDNGRVVTEWARGVLEATEALLTGSAALRAAHTGTLRVAASQTIAEYLVPIWLAKLRTAMPDAAVRLEVMNSAGVIDAVRASSCDVGFVESPGVPADLTATTVRRDELRLVVAPGHPFAGRASAVTRKELAASQLVVREVGSGTREVLERALGNLDAVDLLELDSNAAVKISVASGAGCTVISQLAVAAELADSRLVEVPVHGLDLRRLLRMVSRRDYRPNEVATTLARLAHHR
ncbi:molybdate transport repressor ModE-like protein [Antricoccus suffuscus]|uniref:Molybdate transport repressor ModE-like protein n=1 Tax=Antricoccus suffuscus TaxID=1629062 RepID=A0A2T1A3T0_9ACTN|nr:LysR family transcriptional regulator [Antricoccus suffuscus]PRZ43137.1 molybdate transport repressor ModE-like protein [Antricoccus suffuscus]